VLRHCGLQLENGPLKPIYLFARRLQRIGLPHLRTVESRISVRRKFNSDDCLAIVSSSALMSVSETPGPAGQNSPWKSKAGSTDFMAERFL